MLRQAAAAKFGVDASEVLLVKGKAEAGGKSATYGELAAEAAKITPPDVDDAEVQGRVRLRIHRQGARSPKGYGRLDSADKVHAKAQYALDYHPEGTLTALLARSPKFGGKVASFDDAAAKAIKGVTDVVQISNGVAVVATDFWAAKKGRDALKVTWDDSRRRNALQRRHLRRLQEAARQAGP